MEDTQSKYKVDVSLVIPVYNEEESLAELEQAICDALKDKYSYEILFIDDGSSDSSWAEIKKLKEKKPSVMGISLSHNCGKSAALQVGFDEAKGEYVVTMDSDLQDDPNEVPEMIQMLKDGYDLVSGWKKERHDPISKTIPSKFFNYVTRKVAGINLHDFNCGLKAYRATVVKDIYLYGELHRYIPMLAKRAGYGRITEKVVKHHARKYGNTKFGFSRFMNGFLDLVTITFVQKYLQKPMHFFGSVGVLLLLMGGGINMYMAFIKLYYGEGIGNRPLLFLGILLMVVGVQFFSTGLIGELINKTQVKRQKPRIREKVGL